MAIFANSFIMAAVVWIFHIVKTRLLIAIPIAIGRRLPNANFVFVLFWLAYEFSHHRWDLAWPWLSLGNAFASVPSFIQWYEYTGTCGGSLWVLLVNLMVFNLVKNKLWLENKLQIVRILSAIIFPIGFSLAIYYSYTEKVNPVNVVVVQPNIDPYNEKFSQMGFEEQLEKMLGLAKQQVDSTTDYLVFPETALTESIWENNLPSTATIHHLRTFQKQFPKLKIVTGAATWYLYEKGEELSVSARENQLGYYDAFNTALQVDSSKNIQVYH